MNSAADSTQNQTESSRGLWTVKDEGEGTLRVCLEGNWELDQTLPKPEDILASEVAGGVLRNVRFDSRALTGWASGLLVFLRDLIRVAAERRVEIDRAGLPEGVWKLLFSMVN